MALAGILATVGDATTNQAPASLSTPNPYPTPYVDIRSISAAWTSQGTKALFPRDSHNEDGQVPLLVAYKPSAGAAVTYTVTVWVFDNLANSWFKWKANNPTSYTGLQSDLIYYPQNMPTYFQLSSISSGTIAIYFDNGLADAK